MAHRATEPGRQIPTLEDVARLAGVSRATVSRVVNTSSRVAPATVESVTRAIHQLGYRTNASARALVTKRVGAVAVVVPEADERVFSDPFFPQAYHGAVSAFAGVDTQVLLAMAEPGADPTGMVRYLSSGHLDGAIVLSHHGPDFARRLQGSGYPVVFVGDPGLAGFAHAELDQFEAAAIATRHLIECGARRIATITGPMDMGSGVQRLLGFRATMAEAGLTPLAEEIGDFTTAGGTRAAERLLATADRFDGLFVASDLMAFGAVRTLQHAGIRIPDQVKVVGFDNSSAARQTEPALTTMTNPPAELARSAGQLLLAMLSGEVPDSPVILHSRLIRRGSTGPWDEDE